MNEAPGLGTEMMRDRTASPTNTPVRSCWRSLVFAGHGGRLREGPFQRAEDSRSKGYVTAVACGGRRMKCTSRRRHLLNMLDVDVRF